MTPAVVALHRRTFRSLRRHRNYRLFFTGQIVSVTGSWMQNVALAWLVIELSSSPLAVGALALCRFLPFTVLGLLGGVLVDRTDTRRLVTWSQGAQMILSVVLAVVTLTDVATLPLVYLLAALGGVALAIDAPGRQALTFQLVGPSELPNAVALNSSMFNLSRIVGPAIGGLVVAAFGVGACFAINAVSFLAVLAALRALDLADLYPVERDRATRLITGLREGLGFAWHNRELRAVLGVIVVTSSLGFNFHVILPLLASQTLDAGPEVYGLLAATFGAGAFVGRDLRSGARTREQDGARHGLGGLRDQPARTRAADHRLGVCPLPLRRRSVLHTADVEREHDRAAARTGPSSRPTARHLPVRIRRSRTGRRPPLRLARPRGRHRAVVRRRGVAGVAAAVWAARELGVRPFAAAVTPRSGHPQDGGDRRSRWGTASTRRSACTRIR